MRRSVQSAWEAERALSAAVAQYSLDAAKEYLATLEDLPGDWPVSASLARFGWAEMPPRILRRFVVKIKIAHLGHEIDGKPSACWVWMHNTTRKGYGKFFLGFVDGQKVEGACHRIAFEHWIGFLPAGWIVDHQCNTKTCCNPAHLWPETNENNIKLAWQRAPWKIRNQYSKD